MKEFDSAAAPKRAPYVAPAVERVILDPVKEMLAACPIVSNAKIGLACLVDVNFS